jgi:hypothetical protein
MAVLQFIQAQKFVLAGAGASIGDTTILLQSFTGIDNTLLSGTDLGTKQYGTLEPGNGTQEEAISFTGVTQNSNGTATLTGVKTCLFKQPYTETSGLAKSHAGASTFILSNDAGFYNNIMTYMNTALSSGAVPATTSVNGIVTLSATPATAATPVVVSESDPRLPTANPTTLFALKAFYPVNSIYMEISGTNPATTLGFGTWSAWGEGRVPVGVGTGTKVATFASRASNVITVTGLSNRANNEFQTGQAVLYSAPSGAMTGLTHNTTYYIVKTGNLTFSLATDLANAQNGTVISLSSDGTGTQTFTKTLTARAIGETGGEENHAMSATELLAHTHSFTNPPEMKTTPSGSSGDAVRNNNARIEYGAAISSTGGNAAMNVMQPFITCYMWLRTA